MLYKYFYNANENTANRNTQKLTKEKDLANIQPSLPARRSTKDLLLEKETLRVIPRGQDRAILPVREANQSAALGLLCVNCQLTELDCVTPNLPILRCAYVALILLVNCGKASVFTRKY